MWICLREFADHYPIAGVIAGALVSLLWFVAGRHSLSHNRRDAAFGWQCVAILIMAIVLGRAIAQREWIGFVLGLGVLYVEARSIRRIVAGDLSQH